MNKEIWKFPISINDYQLIDIPRYGEILSVQVQNGGFYIWVMVNPKEEIERRYFEIFSTGESFEVDENIKRKYIGTIQEGYDVWHLFERLH